ncbi:MAG: 2-amino-4-hydroxy-6-hydroxymethyldihydropteridine diphosphokinase [Gammaproteobacteria bacterium]|nr:2-amino-4-hydroxy-6-hydroxymethyldihydropteridine diphosphokinase [Gammaproteobacteria bacterium]
MNNVFIGLGSNLDNPLSQLKAAIEHIKQVNAIKLVAVSGFYSSAPMGPQDQPDYINAVIEISTSLEAELLLDELQKIENEQGRVRKERWGARTLDLDILLYGDEVITSKRLTVPHSGISERNFVLYPLQDLVDANFKIPGLGKLGELVASCPVESLKRLSEN